VIECQPGDLVEIWEGGRIISAVVLAHEKGRWRVVTEEGREMRLAGSRMAHRAGSTGRTDAAAGARAAAAHSAEATRQAEGIEVASLWELLTDAGGRHTARSLASLALGDTSTSATSAIIRRLSAEKTYFDRKGDDWVARSRSAVEETYRRLRTEAERERRREAFLQRMRSRLAGETPAGEADPEDELYMPKLIDLAVQGDESVTRKEAVSLLKDLGLAGPIPWLSAFDLLVRLGIFTQDENLELRRFGVSAEFPGEVLSAAAKAATEAPAGPRKDLTGLTLFTIDDPETVEIDDGLSCQEQDDGTLMAGVHIADPSAFVKPGDVVDEEALRRAATYYLPDTRLPMLPPVISEDAASLVEGRDRPALSFFIHVGPGGRILRFEILPSTIRSSAKLGYEEADRLATGPPEQDPSRAAIQRALSGLRAVAEKLRDARLKAGAMILGIPEVSVRVSPDGGIQIKRSDQRGFSRGLVAEMMILVNSQCAGFCATHEIPAIFRRQAPPEFPPEPLPEGPYDPVATRLVKRSLHRGEVGLVPDVHYALGVPAYLQITSPLRRYQDMAVIRQVKAWLAGEPLPCDAETLGRIAASTEEVERSSRKAESAVSAYWILKYLLGRIGETVEGVVINVETRRSAVELCETLCVAGITARPDHVPGQRVRMVIEDVRPRLGSIRLREIESRPG
jgi:exoribonuclease-2